jgi:hypothetical protein
MSKRVQAVVVVVTFLLSFYSYSPTYSEILQSEKWTFMVYSCADCNLEGWQLAYMNEMASVGSTADVDIVVQMDRIDGYSSSYGDWTDCKRFYVTKGLTPASENAIDSLGEVNMGDSNTLADFLIWAVQDYPADGYFVMIIGHGYLDGVCPDWSNRDILTPVEIRWALSQAKNITGAEIDVIAIEGCQQAALEIAYEIGDYSDLIIASEEVSTHWPYGYIISDLVNAHGTMNSSSIASMVVDYYSQYSWMGGDIMTLSAFNLSKVKTEVATAATGLADSLIANVTRFAHAILVAASRAESHEPIGSPEGAASCRDLYDFALEVKWRISDTSIQFAAANLMSAIEDACIAEWHGPGHQDFHGLYIYLPDDEEVYDARKSIFGNSYPNAHPLWTQDTTWDNLLSLLFTTYAPGLRSREQIVASSFTSFDSNNDGYLDALHVTLDVCTDGDPVDVTAHGYLIDPLGDPVDQSNCTWKASSTGGLGDVYLQMPSGGLEGLYSVKISVYDEHGVFEDEVLLQQIALLPEEMQHAVSVQGISPTKTVIGQGYSAKIQVTVRNDGHYLESLNVTIFVNGTLVNDTQLVVPAGGGATFTVHWDTADQGFGNYTLTAFVKSVDGEANTTDNFYQCGKEACISLPGDVDADHDIDIFDIVKLTCAYGTVEGQLHYESNHDINGDGNINIFDIVIAASNYGQSW